MDNELHTISDAIQKIADALADFAETVSGLFGGYFDMQELPELPERTRWKPVRVLGCSSNTTTPRKRIHRIQRRG